MSTSLGPSVMGYALLLAVALVATAVIGRARSPVLSAALVVLELAVVLQALVDLVSLLRGEHGASVATNVGYLIASLAALPVSVATVRLDSGRWATTALAVGCVLVAVVSLRLHQTLVASNA